MKGTYFSAGAYLLDTNVHKAGPTGNEGTYLPIVLPQFYAVTDFGLDRVRFGLGVNNVFGLKEDYGNRGTLRTLSDKASLSVINIAPTVAYQVTDQLSLGAELNVYYADLDLRRNVLLGPPPIPEGSFRYRAHDWSLGPPPASPTR